MLCAMEAWEDIPGYEGRYQVSSLGRVKSLTRRVHCGKNGAGVRLIPERILRAGRRADGHLSVVLGHKQPGSQVHQLVLLAFVGPPEPGQEVRHINGDPTDNRLCNLQYGSRTENILDVYRIGKAWRKLTAEDVAEIRKQLEQGTRGVDLAKAYGVSQTTISNIKHGRIYSWLK